MISFNGNYLIYGDMDDIVFFEGETDRRFMREGRYPRIDEDRYSLYPSAWQLAGQDTREK